MTKRSDRRGSFPIQYLHTRLARPAVAAISTDLTLCDHTRPATILSEGERKRHDRPAQKAYSALCFPAAFVPPRRGATPASLDQPASYPMLGRYALSDQWRLRLPTTMGPCKYSCVLLPGFRLQFTLFTSKAFQPASSRTASVIDASKTNTRDLDVFRSKT